jgi:hypothetical protein
MWTLKNNEVQFLGIKVGIIFFSQGTKLSPRERRKMFKIALKTLNVHATECSNKIEVK